MPEYAIFLTPVEPTRTRPAETVRAHCLHLDRLEAAGRMIAAGPFDDAAGGGMVIGSFPNSDEALKFAQADPFVLGGYSQVQIRPWQWSHRENGHLGLVEPTPGVHPRFLDTLRLRATAREFSGQALDPSVVHSLLSSAVAAPSEFNLQPWRPIVCHAIEDRRRLQRCCLDQRQVAAAAVAVVCAVDLRVFEEELPRAVDELIARGRYDPEQRDAAIAHMRSCYAEPRDAAIRNGTIFGHQLLLGGISRGLAGFWLGGFDEVALRAEFCLPECTIVAGVVGLGWAKARGEPMPRQPVERIVGWGRCARQSLDEEEVN